MSVFQPRWSAKISSTPMDPTDKTDKKDSVGLSVYP